MITHDEARKELKQILLSKIDVLYDYITQQEKKDKLLEKLKERDIPLKVIVGLDIHHRLDFTCFNCGRDVVLKDKYCSHCGQRLDWGDGK
jgi:predicted RNA-binding Zn-ribbon protein involved in translation (DUF1610 family)